MGTKMSRVPQRFAKMINVVLLLLCHCGVWTSQGLEPLAKTKRGWIRGLHATDGDYVMFLGVPYAKVNHSNPFGESIPHPDFKEAFDAFDDSVICPQKEQLEDNMLGSLDCLQLNIYVPNRARNKIPVLVWIYGGGFQTGSAGRNEYGPKYFVGKDIILVTMNYRVGPYGFMCLDRADVPGNQGLKDQLTALRWLKENIEAFGGDANKITIFGESSGGACVDFHLVSEQEKLFDKVIMQSGSTLAPWVMMEQNTKEVFRISKRLGLRTDDIGDALKFLGTLDPHLLIATVSKMFLVFLPCVEKEFEGVERFVTKHPLNTDTIPKAKSIPLLAGSNNREVLLVGDHIGENDKDPWTSPNYLRIAFDLNDDQDLMTQVRQFYTGDEDSRSDVKYKLMEFRSDILFNHPMHRSLQRYLENGGKVYHYLFSYSGGRNFFKRRAKINEDGASHADELGYLFDVSYFPESPSKEDQLMIDRITTMWANFVKFGDPTPETSDLLPVKWTTMSKDVPNYIDINREMSLKTCLLHERMAFWDRFYETNKHLIRC